MTIPTPKQNVMNQKRHHDGNDSECIQQLLDNNCTEEDENITKHIDCIKVLVRTAPGGLLFLAPWNKYCFDKMKCCISGVRVSSSPTAFNELFHAGIQYGSGTLYRVKKVEEALCYYSKYHPVN